MTTTGHELRVQKAKRAIDEVFSDKSVDQDVTRESLIELIEDLQQKMETLED